MNNTVATSKIFASAAENSTPLLQSPFYFDVDRFLRKINFETEEEANDIRNVRKAKQAFLDFMDGSGLILSKECFKELLKEKWADNKYRADGVTPNWYHELREVIQLLGLIRAGKIPQAALNRHGGIDVIVGAILCHDSWEDFNKDPGFLFEKLEGKINKWHDTQEIDDNGFRALRYFADKIANIVKLRTRKVPVVDSDTGSIIRDSNGKIQKRDRYGEHGNQSFNMFHKDHVTNPFAVLAGIFDSIEGLFTRAGVEKFSVSDDIKYVKERVLLYKGREKSMARKWPAFQEGYLASKAMMRIGLSIMRDYCMLRDPEAAMEIPEFEDDLVTCVATAAEGYKYIPDAFRPDKIMMSRLHRMAQEAAYEGDSRLVDLLEHKYFPVLVPLLGNRQGTLLQTGSKTDYTLTL